jgi:membrane protease YdiL (CAAX protease family)
MRGVLRHALVLAMVRLAPIRDRRWWFLLSLLLTAAVGGSAPSVGSLAMDQLPGHAPAETAGDDSSADPAERTADVTPPPEPDATERLPRITTLRPDGGSVWVVDGPSWLGWPDTPSGDTETVVRHGTPDEWVGIHLEILTADAETADDVRSVARSRQAAADRRAREALGVTVDPERAVSIVTVVRPQKPRPPTAKPDGLGSLLLGVAMVHALGLLAAGLPRWRSRGFFATLRIAPVHPLSILLGGLLAAMAGGALAASFTLGGWALSALIQGASLPLAPHHLLAPAALLPALALAQRTFLTAPDTRTAGFRLIAMQVGLGVLLASWFIAVGVGGLEAGAAVPIVGAGALATGYVPVRTPELLISLFSSGLTTTAILAWSTKVLRSDPVEAGDPTLRRRARGNYLPEAIVLMLLAVGGVTTFTMPLMRWGVGGMLVFGQVGFMLTPSLLMPMAVSLRTVPLLGLTLPPLRAWPLSLLMVPGTLSLALLSLLATEGMVSPFQAEQAEVMGRMLTDLAAGPGILLLTLLPAVCEEVLFRGAILGLLRTGRAAWVAVVVQAFAFALLHGMLLRVPPTLALGLLLGFLRIRTRSIWPGVVVHALHNACALLVGAEVLGPDALGSLGEGPLIGAAVVASVVAIVAAWKSRAPTQTEA